MNEASNESIIVSIICNVFNQEQYVKRAIDGFLMQKTNFPFEILIHDDASTDSTPAIIREYEKKYPGLIKPIYQRKNQYSTGISITNVFQLPRARGKYVALCEGDDYWTDDHKLQIQVDVLESNPNVDICAHTVSIIRNEREDGKVQPYSKDCIFSAEQVILNGGSFIGTCSIMYRKSIDLSMPSFRKNNSLDYTIQIHGSLRGGMLFIDKNMGCYRIGSAGSWTERILRNPEKVIKHYNRMVDLLNEIDRETVFQFKNVIQFAIQETNFQKYYALNNIESMYTTSKKLRYCQNKKIYSLFTMKTAIKTGIKYQFPFLYKYFHKE